MAFAMSTTPTARQIPMQALSPQEKNTVLTYQELFGNRAQGYVEEYLQRIGAYDRPEAQPAPQGITPTTNVSGPTPTSVTSADGTVTNLIASPTVTPTAVTTFDELLRTLAGGGTPEMKATTTARTEEVSRVRQQQEDFTKEDAFTDANALMQKAISDALRIAAPKITAYAEGAGTSRSSLAALQTQEAATRGAIEGAAQGAQLTTAYGQVYNQLANVLEGLTRQDPNSPAALLAQAITGSKGMVQYSNVPSPVGTPVQQQGTGQGTQQTQQQRVLPAPTTPAAAGQNVLNPYDDPYGFGNLNDYAPIGRPAPQVTASGTRSNIVIGQGTTDTSTQYDINSSAAFDQQGYRGSAADVADSYDTGAGSYNYVGESAYDAVFGEE